MGITAFPVLARILADRRMMNTRVGNFAISCAAFDDLTAWCLLAVITVIARPEANKARSLALRGTHRVHFRDGFWFARYYGACSPSNAAPSPGRLGVAMVLLLLSVWATEALAFMPVRRFSGGSRDAQRRQAG